MSRLDDWLREATRHLASESAAMVRREIQDHYEAARDAALVHGSSTEGADAIAVNSLGDAKTANCQYRQVLLTSAEAGMLRQGKLEARAVCSRPWVKWSLVAVPVALVEAASVLFFHGKAGLAWDLLLAGIAMSPLFAALLLPIYTPARSRVFRYAKWFVMTAAVVLLFGPEALKWSWLLISCLWPMAWSEWTRASLRRKLPVSAWPRHLYL
jgi:hypothetical protein